ncbi:response regulator [Aquincola sp. MAHUQ-54]|uniref:Response regulator n=1 Tax=Aquincola agrisoli TaxID=3119538 RepID=A0AAW9QL19_9BURK
MAVSVSRLFAGSVREVVPLLQAAHLGYTFAEKGGGWLLEDDGDADALARMLHRLYCAAAAMVSHGAIAFDLAAKPLRSGGCALRVRIGGTGRMRLHGRIAQVLQGLDLAPDASADASLPRLQRAHGVCPASGARVDFGCLPLAGFMFSASCSLRRAVPHGVPPAPPVRPAPRLWLVHGDAVNAACVASQAQHHGWAVVPMGTLAEALRRARHHAEGQAWPALAIVFVDPSPAAAAGWPAADLAALRLALPPRVPCIAAAATGSAWLADPEALAGYDLHCHPLCHDEWAGWSARLQPDADTPSGLTRPLPLEPADRVRVLVVDDDDYHRFVGEKLLSAMGYAVHTASDGEQAIDACRRSAPALVLMDLEMPVLDGYEATRRLRALQRSGAMAPCRIVAHSGSSDALARQRAMQAGFDGFLAKPARPACLRAEVLRWCTAHRAAG